jgi:hypothetical protein|tara:strand:- start:3795 stop:4433 length:639 start_codon:yes stop_codon:yes gene_type:complete
MALEDIQRMQMVQDVAQSPETMDDMQVMRRGGQGLQAAPMNTQAPIPQFVPDEVMSMDVKQNLNEMLTATLPDGDSIAAKALEKIVKNNKLLSDMIDQTRDIASAATGGGLMQLAAGGEFSGMVPGDGHGMEDNVYMPIKEGEEQVATLAVSPTEYVVDSYTMAALGNGNPVEGAERMDEVVKSIRKEAYGTDKQPNQIDGLAALEPMMERV